MEKLRWARWAAAAVMIGAGAVGPVHTIAARQAAPPSAVRIARAPCDTPPALHCPDGDCQGGLVTNGGSVIEAKTGRPYFLDYQSESRKPLANASRRRRSL